MHEKFAKTLPCTKVTDAGISALKECIHLRTLVLIALPRISTEALSAVLQSTILLQELTVRCVDALALFAAY